MTRDELIETARVLESVPPEVVNELDEKSQAILAEVDRRMLGRADITELVGANNLEMMQDNHANHLRFVHSILGRLEAESLVDTVLWVFRAYRTRGFQLAYWPAQLHTWTEVMREQLTPGSWEKIEPLYEWFLMQQHGFTTLSDSFVGEGPAETPPH